MTFMWFDHFLVNIKVSLKKPCISTKPISHYKYKSIDKDVFLADLKTTCLELDPPEDLDQIVDLYNSTLIDLVKNMHL